MRRPLSHLLPIAAAVFLLGVQRSPGADPEPIPSPPPLGPPSGRVVRVATEPALQAAVAAVTPDTTILIAPGTYRLTKSLQIRGVASVTIRGASDNRDAVVLVGRGMTNGDYGAAPYGIWAGDGADRLQIANLTIRDFYFHPIILNGGAARPHIYNLHLIDAGQQFLKSNPDASGTGNDFGLVEYSVFEFTTTGRDDYPKAIDIHGARGWTIRHNLFRNIRAPQPLLNGPAILAWRGSRDTIVDGNTFINCQREIVMGAEDVSPDSHAGGVVRNNMIYRDRSVLGDAAISVWGSPRTIVAHNTILVSGTYRNAIEARFVNTRGVVIANNLADGDIVLRDGATAAFSGNVTSARSVDFVDAAHGNLHLTRDAAVAAVSGVASGAARLDWDGQARPVRGADPGADQR